MKFFIVILLTVAFCKPTVNNQVKDFDLKILEDLDQNGESEFLIVLKHFADLNTEPHTLHREHFSATTFKDFVKTLRKNVGEYVLNALQHQHTEDCMELNGLLSNLGAKVIKHYPIANSILVRGNRFAYEAILNHKDVEEVSGNFAFQSELNYESNDIELPGFEISSEGVEWNIKTINAHKVWELDGNSRGEGTIYANADTGIEFTHESLAANYLGNQNGSYNHNYAWFDGVKRPIKPGRSRCKANSREPCDDNGHGTHTTR